MTNLKTFLFTILMLFALTPTFSQQIQENLDKKTLRKMQKQERQQRQREEMAAKKEYIADLINAKRFVLEADNLSGKTGAKINVNSSLNFFAMDSSRAILQVGQTSGIGYNGVGGVTEECSVNRYEIKENKNNLVVTIYLQGRLSSYTVFLNASFGTMSTARVSGLTGGVINFHGRIVGTNESKVFKGNATY